MSNCKERDKHDMDPHPPMGKDEETHKQALDKYRKTKRYYHYIIVYIIILVRIKRQVNWTGKLDRQTGQGPLSVFG
jgi:hypothetical protein